VALGEALEVVHAGHLAVVAHDLADDGGGAQAGEAGQVDRALGVAGADQDAAGLGAQREDVAGADDVGGAEVLVAGDADGLGAVGRGDAGGDAAAGLDRDGEGGAHVAGVGGDHHRQAQLGDPLGGEGEADEAATLAAHEVDLLGGAGLGGDDEVALVLAVLVVDEDDHAAAADDLDAALDVIEVVLAHEPVPSARSSGR
jgi:hypothetical protein